MIHGFFQMTGALQGSRQLHRELGGWMQNAHRAGTPSEPIIRPPTTTGDLEAYRTHEPRPPMRRGGRCRRSPLPRCPGRVRTGVWASVMRMRPAPCGVLAWRRRASVRVRSGLGAKEQPAKGSAWGGDQDWGRGLADMLVDRSTKTQVIDHGPNQQAISSGTLTWLPGRRSSSGICWPITGTWRAPRLPISWRSTPPRRPCPLCSVQPRYAAQAACRAVRRWGMLFLARGSSGIVGVDEAERSSSLSSSEKIKRWLNAIGATGKLFSVLYVKVERASPLRSATALNAMGPAKYARRTVSSGNVDLTRMLSL